MDKMDDNQLMEHFDTAQDLQDRARVLMHEGYVVLVAQGHCGHWIGYTAFKSDGSMGYRLLWTKGADMTNVDPKAIYVSH